MYQTSSVGTSSPCFHFYLEKLNWKIRPSTLLKNAFVAVLAVMLFLPICGSGTPCIQAFKGKLLWRCNQVQCYLWVLEIVVASPHSYEIATGGLVNDWISHPLASSLFFLCVERASMISTPVVFRISHLRCCYCWERKEISSTLIYNCSWLETPLSPKCRVPGRSRYLQPVFC